MSNAIPISAPAGFAPEHAMAFADADGRAIRVDATRPLPGAATFGATSSTALTGSASGSGAAGPFVPELGRPVWVTLSGNWSGSVQLLRSTDGGATRLALTAGGQPAGAFTANANEPVVEESAADATYYLPFSLASGALGYRVSQ